jgi:hypothetical protein
MVTPTTTVANNGDNYDVVNGTIIEKIKHYCNLGEIGMVGTDNWHQIQIALIVNLGLQYSGEGAKKKENRYDDFAKDYRAAVQLLVADKRIDTTMVENFQ